MEKMEIAINSQVDSYEKAKELLADLEVLNEKYDVMATVTVYPPAVPEAFYKQI